MSERSSVYKVNILFLIVLILLTINFLPLGLPQFELMILNQVFFILLPSLIYLKRTGLS